MAVLNYTNAFLRLHEFFSPVTRGLLRLPPEAADLFILSIVKKDLGAAGLYSVLSRGVMTDAQLTVTLIVMTLFVPCFASVMVLFKEWGVFVAVFIWVTSFFLAFFTGGAVAIFFT